MPLPVSPFLAIAGASILLSSLAARAAPYPSAVLIDDDREGIAERVEVRLDGSPLEYFSEEYHFIDDLDGDGRPELLIGGEAVDTVYLVPSSLADGRDITTAQLPSFVRYTGLGDGTRLSCDSFRVTRISSSEDLDGDGIGELYFGGYTSGGQPVSTVSGRVEPGTVVDLSGTGPARIRLATGLRRVGGDLNGDGHDELVYEEDRDGAIELVVIAGAADRPERFDPDDVPDTDKLLTVANTRGFEITVTVAGDLDDDGFDDLLVDDYFARVQAAVISGAPDLSVRIESVTDLERFAIYTECPDEERPYTCPVTAIGDVDGDGFDDLAVSELILYGSPGNHPLPSYLSTDFNGDGVEDLLSDREVILGRREDGTPPSPVDVRARFGPASADILWAAPTDDAGIVAYEVTVGDDFAERLGPDARSAIVPRPADLGDDPIDYRVAAIGADGRASPAVMRPFAYDDRGIADFGGVSSWLVNMLPIEGLRAVVHSRGVLALAWDNPPKRYFVYRDGERIASVQGNTYIERDLEPGRDHTWFVVQGAGPDLDRSVVERNPAPFCFAGCRPADAIFATLGRSERVTARAGDAPGDGGAPEAPALPAPNGLRADVYSATAAELFWVRPGTFGLRYEVYRDGSSIGETDGVSFFDDTFERGRGAAYEVVAIGRDGTRSVPRRLVVPGSS